MSMNEDFLAALAAAEALYKDPRKPKRPNRFLVRDLLLPLGETLLDDPAAAAPAAERVRAVVDRDRESWQAAVDEELTLAATEHVRSCDPKALKLPRYDFPYTVAARHRLEARLRAAAELDMPASEVLLEQIERADEALAPYLERGRSGAGGG
jgi:hypothetical protein